MSTIDKNSNNPQVQGISAEDDLERERQRKHLLAMSSAQQTGASGLFMLFALLFGALQDGNNSLIDNSIVSKLTQAFGLDNAVFTNTVADVRAGRVSVNDAALSTSSAVRTNSIDYSKLSTLPMAKLVAHEGPTLLNPDLVEKMERDPAIRHYVQLTFEAAERHGLDGKLLANQFWAESRFNSNAVSPVGARGIAQFMPSHQGKWGLESNADFFDPEKSIEAGARFMKHLTDRVGDQRLALVAYNGGEKAVNWVKNHSRDGNISVEDWMEFAHHERVTKGVGSRNLWRNQTYEYVAKIDSTFWNADKVARAQTQQQTLSTAFAEGGVDQTQGKPDLAKDGVTVAFTHDVVTNEGVDQTQSATAGEIIPSSSPEVSSPSASA